MNHRLHFSLLIFFVSLLFTFLLWNFYFNSAEAIDRTFTANLIFAMGTLFSAAAGLFAWSLESRRDFLEKEVKRKAEELVQKARDSRKAEIATTAIYQSCQLLFSAVKINGVLDTVMDLVSKVFRADEGSLMLLDSSQELYIAASRGIPERVARAARVRLGEKVAGRAAQLRREFLLVDGIENYAEFKDAETNPLIHSAIVCPLICQNELLGVLNLNRMMNQENFTVADLLNVSIFAAQVAQAIRNASLYEAVERKVAELEESAGRVKFLEEQFGSRS